MPHSWKRQREIQEKCISSWLSPLDQGMHGLAAVETKLVSELTAKYVG